MPEWTTWLEGWWATGDDDVARQVLQRGVGALLCGTAFLVAWLGSDAVPVPILMVLAARPGQPVELRG